MIVHKYTGWRDWVLWVGMSHGLELRRSLYDDLLVMIVTSWQYAVCVKVVRKEVVGFTCLLSRERQIHACDLMLHFQTHDIVSER
jgi:hypothetical protein